MSAALLAAQTARFAALDPLLPPAVEPPPGRLLRAKLADGSQVSGVLTEQHTDPTSAPALWSALRVWELHPLLPGEVSSTEALSALIGRWRPVVRGEGGDTSAAVSWPSRDAAGTRALLDHGFTPLCVLAVRESVAGPADHGGVTVRAAGPADIDVAVRLALAETQYSALVGGTVLRPAAARIKRDTIAAHLAQGDLVLLAERDGVPVGLAEGWVNDSEPGSWAETRLPHGRWGYVNCLSVAPGQRGSGVGRALMSVMHKELHDAGATRTFLYYNPPNPLSSVFWARQRYRPLWTIWEVRPAGAVR